MADAAKVILGKFNEDIPQQHIMKILFGCGIYAAFRGSSEHVLFSPEHVSFGIYPMNYEVPELRGVHYVTIDAFGSDKSHKISVHKNYSRETSSSLNFPINENDPNCFGASLRRYIRKLAPGQKRMYCYWRTGDASIFDGSDGTAISNIFHPRKPLGQNKIRELFMEGAEILGLPKDFLPHSLRALCITRLVNSGDVSLAETMEVARHSSVAASKEYMHVDGVSNFNRMKALGSTLPVQNRKSPFSNHSTQAAANINPQLSTVTPTGTGLERSSIVEFPLDEKDDDVSIHVGAYREPDYKNSKITMTQQGIDSLKEEIADFKNTIAQQTMPPPMSQNQIEIAELREIVKDLKEQLEGHMHDKLYFDSVTNDYCNEIAILREENEILKECSGANSSAGFRAYENTRNMHNSINGKLEAGEYTRARQRAMGMRVMEEKRKRERERKVMSRRRLF